MEPRGTGRWRSRGGLLLGVPITLSVGLLLAWADPIFGAWFDLNAVLTHLILAAAGAWLVLGLARAASARQPSPELRQALALGTVEAVLILGGLCGLYMAFVAAQFVALSDGGHHVLVTHGLTYAQYARSGFFQLLGCAAITLIVLLAVRAFAEPDHRVIASLSWLTVVLTVGVVVVAIRRLQLYEAAFGLTLLRLACLVAAGWIGAVFLLLGATIPHRGLPRRRFTAHHGDKAGDCRRCQRRVGIANPASIVARTREPEPRSSRPYLDHEPGRDPRDPDAVPTLRPDSAGLVDTTASRIRTNSARCRPEYGMNVSEASAHDELTRACQP